MTAPRIIAACDDYAQLMCAFRARIAELNTTGESVDRVAGLPDRYTMKLLAPDPPPKSVGRTSLGPLLGALGLRLLVVEDAEKLARIAHRLEKRQIAGSAMLAQGRRRPRRFSLIRGNPELARAMRDSQILGQSARKRKQIARMAANARWAKYREERAAA